MIAEVENECGEWELSVYKTEDGALELFAYNRHNVAINTSIVLLNVTDGDLEKLGKQLIKAAK